MPTDDQKYIHRALTDYLGRPPTVFDMIELERKQPNNIKVSGWRRFFKVKDDG